jgi:murein DD-endopeptidase MepM/ murein hydrolase activator NlpD
MVGIAVMLVVNLLRGGMRDAGMISFILLLISATPAITGILRATWMRGFAMSAFILALSCVAIAGFFVYAMSMESGGWNPTPTEAFIVPLSWIGAIFFPIAGMMLWHAGRPSGQRRGFFGLGCSILILVVLVLLGCLGLVSVVFRTLPTAPRPQKSALAGPKAAVPGETALEKLVVEIESRMGRLSVLGEKHPEVPRLQDEMRRMAAELAEIRAKDDLRLIKAGDVLSFLIVEDQKEPVVMKVMASGDVSLPYVGLIRAEGKTCSQLTTEVRAALVKSNFKSVTLVIAFKPAAAAATNALINGAKSEVKKAADLPPPPLADGFDFPVGTPDAEGYHITRGLFSHAGPDSVHTGEDWSGGGSANSDLGDPVYAVADGVVVHSANVKPGHGNVIIIQHLYLERDGSRAVCESSYHHLQERLVEEGQIVRRRQKIGTMGNAGGLYPVHLHFELRRTPGIGLETSKFEKTTENYWWPSQFIREHRPEKKQPVVNPPRPSHPKAP